MSSSIHHRSPLLAVALAVGLSAGLAGCTGTDSPSVQASAPEAKPAAAAEDMGPTPAPKVAAAPSKPVFAEKVDPKFAALYQPMIGDKFPVNGVKVALVRKGFERKEIDYSSNEPVGTIVIDPHAHYLYYTMPNGRAMRYGVAVGKAGFAWSGSAIIKTKQEWPDWYPPKEMIDRHPELKPQLDKLQSGIGVPGGLRNPLGARAMYLWQGNKDTYFRIHGTLEPNSIGTNASSGCIRMINQDAIDLYSRIPEGTRVVVLGNAHPNPPKPVARAPKVAAVAAKPVVEAKPVADAAPAPAPAATPAAAPTASAPTAPANPPAAPAKAAATAPAPQPTAVAAVATPDAKK